ncbi:MAG: hypothetical protein ABI577_12580 [bacterium]
MKFFVLEFDRSNERLLWTEFEQIESALADLSVKEAARQPQVEVVLLMGNSINDLKVTHGRYFMSPTELVQRMKDRLTADGLVKTG